MKDDIRGNKDYIIDGVGNYQLIIIKEGNYKIVLPLNKIIEDKIIKTDKKSFLVLRNAIIQDIEVLNKILNTKDELKVLIYSNHIVFNLNHTVKYIGSSNYKGFIKNIRLENEFQSCGEYKIIIELTEYNLFFKLEECKNK